MNPALTVDDLCPAYAVDATGRRLDCVLPRGHADRQHAASERQTQHGLASDCWELYGGLTFTGNRVGKAARRWASRVHQGTALRERSVK